jgi:membrane protease YdiL (CAAX protease family)
MKTSKTFFGRYDASLFLIGTPLISIVIALFAPVPPSLAPVLMALVPTLMAILLLGMTEGRHGVIALLRKLGQWRISLKWYVAALGLPLGLHLLIAVAARLLGWIPAIRLNDRSLSLILIIAIFVLLASVTEELGWRGYVLPKLLTRRSALLSALLIGIPWGLLHSPLYLSGMPNGEASMLAGTLVVFAISFVLTWLFVQTGGNLPTIILCHAALNYFGTFVKGITLAQAVFLQAVAWLILAIILALFLGPDLNRGASRKAAMAEVS